MKYFGWSEWDIKWNMSWDNYMLYISSIPKYDSDDKPKLEVKEASEIF